MNSIVFKKQKGAGLIDIMVGLAIGVLVLLAITTSITFYQASKRTAIHGSSALANAMTGMAFMANDVRLAGLGLTANDDVVCSRFNAYFAGNVIADNALMAPISVVDGGNGADTITVMYGNSLLSGAPSRLLVGMGSSTSDINVNLAAGVTVGATALIADPTGVLPCTLIGITGIDTTGGDTMVQHTAVGSQYNPPNPDATYTVSPTYTNDALLMNTGNFRWMTWRINNNVLEVRNNITGVIETIADNIVQMHAEYGVTNGVTDDIRQWVPATGQWANLNLAEIRRIRAVRIAIVARSPQRERAAGGACVTTTQAPIPWVGSASINLSADPNWRCYRYQVMKTVFPLKNILWGGIT